jgi:DnaJ-domain-containing protein 1
MSAAGSRDAVEQALLAYQRSPGKHALGLRQPAVLFASIKDVLQLAGGRLPPAWAAGSASPAVQQAAVFFIGSALLAPGADHYALLGLPQDADTAAVKERYRLMMRLLHPDFAATLPGARWPADAAARVNKAYEVLMSPVLRREYDAQRATPKPQAAAPARPRPVRRTQLVAAAAKPVRTDPRLLLKRLAAGFGAAGTLALLAALLANLQDRPDLVQRVADDAAAAAPGSSRTPAATAPAGSDTDAATLAAAAAARLLQPLPAGAAQQPPAQAHAAASPPHAAPVIPTAAAFRQPQTAAPPVAPLPLAATPAPAQPPIPAPATPSPIALAPTAAAPSPAQVAAAVPSAAARPPNPGVTMAEVHPILSRLLQQLESGAGERMLGLLERDARNAPAAQALLRHYNGLVEGARAVKVASAQFRAEPQEGRLVVIGQVTMQVGDPQAGAVPREFALQAEFMSRDGTVVMTQLTRAQPRP